MLRDPVPQLFFADRTREIIERQRTDHRADGAGDDDARE